MTGSELRALRDFEFTAFIRFDFSGVLVINFSNSGESFMCENSDEIADKENNERTISIHTFIKNSQGIQLPL
jgi:hypothetical protein